VGFDVKDGPPWTHNKSGAADEMAGRSRTRNAARKINEQTIIADENRIGAIELRVISRSIPASAGRSANPA
jgi:hypothetical protein